MKRTLKICLAGGISLGILMCLVYTYRYSLRAGIVSGLLSGLVLGFFIYTIIGFLHGRAVRKIGDGKFRDETGIHHVRSVHLDMTFDHACDLCIESLELIKNCSIQVEDRLNGKIVARAGLNWKTWSDTISFEIKEGNDSHTKVTVSSRPTARTTIVDFGKNLENVEKIISFLQTGLTVSCPAMRG